MLWPRLCGDAVVVVEVVVVVAVVVVAVVVFVVVVTVVVVVVVVVIAVINFPNFVFSLDVAIKKFIHLEKNFN